MNAETKAKVIFEDGQSLDETLMNQADLVQFTKETFAAYRVSAGDSMMLPVVSTTLWLACMPKRGFILDFTGQRETDRASMRCAAQIMGLERRIRMLRAQLRLPTVENSPERLCWVQRWAFEFWCNGSSLLFSEQATPLWLTAEEEKMLATGDTAIFARYPAQKPSLLANVQWMVNIREIGLGA
jgi:hypothetical protein